MAAKFAGPHRKLTLAALSVWGELFRRGKSMPARATSGNPLPHLDEP